MTVVVTNGCGLVDVGDCDRDGDGGGGTSPRHPSDRSTATLTLLGSPSSLLLLYCLSSHLSLFSQKPCPHALYDTPPSPRVRFNMSSKGWFNLETAAGTIPETQFFEGDSAFKALGLTRTQRLYGFAGWYVRSFGRWYLCISPPSPPSPLCFALGWACVSQRKPIIDERL